MGTTSNHRCAMPNSDVSRLLYASPLGLKIRMRVGNETKRDAGGGEGGGGEGGGGEGGGGGRGGDMVA